MKMLTIDEVAEVIGCSRDTVERRIKAGHLRAFRDGRLVRVHPDELERYVGGPVQVSQSVQVEVHGSVISDEDLAETIGRSLGEHIEPPASPGQIRALQVKVGMLGRGNKEGRDKLRATMRAAVSERFGREIHGNADWKQPASWITTLTWAEASFALDWLDDEGGAAIAP